MYVKKMNATKRVAKRACIKSLGRFINAIEKDIHKFGKRRVFSWSDILINRNGDEENLGETLNEVTLQRYWRRDSGNRNYD